MQFEQGKKTEPVSQVKSKRKHPYEQVIDAIKNRKSTGYSLPMGETFSTNDYIYVDALDQLREIEQDICHNNTMDYYTAYRIITAIETKTKHLKQFQGFKDIKRNIKAADKHYWSYTQYCI